MWFWRPLFQNTPICLFSRVPLLGFFEAKPNETHHLFLLALTKALQLWVGPARTMHAQLPKLIGHVWFWGPLHPFRLGETIQEPVGTGSLIPSTLPAQSLPSPVCALQSYNPWFIRISSDPLRAIVHRNKRQIQVGLGNMDSKPQIQFSACVRLSCCHGCNIPPTLRGRGWRVPSSIYLVFPIKGKMEPQTEFQGSPPSPNSICEGVGMLQQTGRLGKKAPVLCSVTRIDAWQRIAFHCMPTKVPRYLSLRLT